MTTFPPQVAKLIPRLASEHDGEALATVRAIERVLKSAGLDWHALARHVEAPPIYSSYSPGYSSPSPAPQRHPDPPPPRRPREPGWSDMLRSEQMVWCSEILKSRMLPLDDKTLSFVTDVLNKLHYGMNFDLDRGKKRKLTGIIRALKEQRQAA